MIRHAAFMVTYNNVEMTKKALASLTVQDIGPLHILIINNGSTDRTREWLSSLGANDEVMIEVVHEPQNLSPTRMANVALRHLFNLKYDKVLGIANDVILPRNLYRLFSMWRRGIVTGSEISDENVPEIAEAHAVSENTPFPVIMWRKWAYEAVVSQDGFLFDEGFFNYASDCDLAVRIASCGIRGIQLDVPYYHYGSATWKLASPEVGKAMTDQADVDRAHFLKKWGFTVDSLEYGKAATDLNFPGIPK